jgi:DNA-directed RNA polymerase subunit alpha
MIANEFEIPRYVRFGDSATDRYARITVEPFERGYGTTVGNSLRRVLLSSLQGTAVTAIRIEDIPHEFSAIPGVQEDVTDVVLNLKKCEISLKNQDSIIFSFSHSGEGPVTASELFKSQDDIEVFNPDHVIFNATAKSAKVDMEVKVANGRGYVTADHFELEHAPLGTVYLDADFSPVNRVNFEVADARVGQSIDYDSLLLEIWTNGSLTPEKALEEASDLLIRHLRIFVKQETEEDAAQADGGEEDPELMRTLQRAVDELELSVRAANCLKAANIRTIGELVGYAESEVLQFHNFGKKSLDEIVQLLDGLGLELGMKAGASFRKKKDAEAAVAEAAEDTAEDAEEDAAEEEDTEKEEE